MVEGEHRPTPPPSFPHIPIPHPLSLGLFVAVAVGRGGLWGGGGWGGYFLHALCAGAPRALTLYVGELS